MGAYCSPDDRRKSGGKSGADCPLVLGKLRGYPGMIKFGTCRALDPDVAALIRATLRERNKPNMTQRRVKLFRYGPNQAVRIPREFELPGDAAIMRKEGQRLIIEPVRRTSLLAVLKTLETLDEDFPPIADPLPEQAP
jgi:antitoxin VapB